MKTTNSNQEKSKLVIDKNLRHGYIFLIGTILLLFSTTLGIELYIRDKYINEVELLHIFEKEEEIKEDLDLPEIVIEDLEDGFISKEEILSIKGNIDREADVLINGELVETYKVFGSKRYFDYEIKLDVGENIITITATDSNGNTAQEEIGVTYEPDYYPIVELSLECTTLKPKYSTGDKIVFNCQLLDQDEKEVIDTTGSVTIHWDTGIQKYAFEGDDLQMIFEVPDGNIGKIQGLVEVEHELMKVSSHFIFMIED